MTDLEITKLCAEAMALWMVIGIVAIEIDCVYRKDWLGCCILWVIGMIMGPIAIWNIFYCRKHYPPSDGR